MEILHYLPGLPVPFSTADNYQGSAWQFTWTERLTAVSLVGYVEHITRSRVLHIKSVSSTILQELLITKLKYWYLKLKRFIKLRNQLKLHQIWLPEILCFPWRDYFPVKTHSICITIIKCKLNCLLWLISMLWQRQAILIEMRQVVFLCSMQDSNE